MQADHRLLSPGSLVQILNVIFWIVPHAVILTVSCSWFDVIINVSGCVRWTIWNTVSPNCRTYMLPVAHQAECSRERLRPQLLHLLPLLCILDATCHTAHMSKVQGFLLRSVAGATSNSGLL